MGNVTVWLNHIIGWALPGQSFIVYSETYDLQAGEHTGVEFVSGYRAVPEWEYSSRGSGSAAWVTFIFCKCQLYERKVILINGSKYIYDWSFMILH